MKFLKWFKQQRMATEWGPEFTSPTLPYPLRVKQGVLAQLVPALRLASGNYRLGEEDANRAVATIVESHLPRLTQFLKRGDDLVQFQVPQQTPLPMLLHLCFGDKTLWVSDQPLLPYPPKEED